MPNTFATQILKDSEKSTIIKWTAIADGSGELTDTLVYDASAYSTPGTKNKIRWFEYATTGTEARLYWMAAVPLFIIGLVTDVPMRHDFSTYGSVINSLPNNAVGAAANGDIQIATTGFTTVGDSITIIMEVEKSS